MSRLPRGVVFGAFLWLAVGGGDAAAQGTVTMIDTSPGVGEGVSLAVTPSGTAFVAYYDRTNGQLKLARCLDAGCTSAAVTAPDTAGDVGLGADLTIGADGRAVVSYGGTAAVKIARCDDDLCSSATTRIVDPVALESRTAVVTGSDGLPLVAYLAGGRLKAVHCSTADCSTWTVSDLAPAGTGSPALAIGSDGRGTIVQGGSFFPSYHHCADAACSSLALDAPPPAPQSFDVYSNPTLGRLGDGRLLHAIYVTIHGPLGPDSYLSFRRCNDARCGSQAWLEARPAARPETAVGRLPDGRGIFAYREGGQVRVRSCSNLDCTAWTESCTVGTTQEYEVAAAADGAPLLAFHRDGGGVGVVHAPGACGLTTVSVDDSSAFEKAGQMAFTVRLTSPAGGGETVAYQTADGTAQAGADYVATSGVVTFAPQQTTALVAVPLLTDAVIEGDETFSFDLTAAGGVTVGDGHAVGTIRDTAPLPQIVAGDCQTVEGDSGFAGCVFPVRLVPATGTDPVTVAYATADGSAAAGSDYVAASGTLTFAPGTTRATVSVSVVGDTAVELDEVFFLRLTSPTNATVLDGEGVGGILDDDAASLSSIELTHGALVTADLAAQPGPVADADHYRVGQSPFSSYEAVVDAVSGDAAPGLALQLLAEDNQTVLAQSQPVGAGSAVALRWARQAGAETRDTIRVGGASCGSACGADDTYRLRFYETTASIPRFNNTSSQVTVVVVQNRTDELQDFLIHFWDADGTLLLSEPGHLFGRAALVLNTASHPELVGRSGSITIAGTGGYGTLTGKAVALEPATGFSFDSPLTYKPR